MLTSGRDIASDQGALQKPPVVTSPTTIRKAWTGTALRCLLLGDIKLLNADRDTLIRVFCTYLCQNLAAVPSPCLDPDLLCTRSVATTFRSVFANLVAGAPLIVLLMCDSR